MIFVTVGTHEQPFDRLVKYIDELVKVGEIKEEVVIQAGYSTYEPVHCKWRKFYSYQEMIKYVKEARIVITHGGPSSFIMPLQIKKVPIVVPRQKKYEEHINDHQIKFARQIAEKTGTIIVVVDIGKLGKTIKNYESLIKDINRENVSNNIKFNAELEKIVNKMFEVKSER